MLRETFWPVRPVNEKANKKKKRKVQWILAEPLDSWGSLTEFPSAARAATKEQEPQSLNANCNAGGQTEFDQQRGTDRH